VSDREFYLVGGGIAGLAAAALLIRDARMPGTSIHVFEQSDVLGGSLDGAGDADAGYVIRGGRMFEAHYGCTLDLFSSIPSLSCPQISVTEEILDFTDRVVTSSRSRLVSGRQRMEAPALNLSRQDRWDLARLSLRSEQSIGPARIEDYFALAFFKTNFWFMWCSMFAFQPWHSLIEFRRYMRRFIHLLPGFNRLEGILRSPYNQYDSLVVPLQRWLLGKGVNIHTGTSVRALSFSEGEAPSAITSIELETAHGTSRIQVKETDLVMVTLGSMTEDSTLGSMDTPAPLRTNPERGAWKLWRTIARRSAVFGNPDVFARKVNQSMWASFTVTLKDPTFFKFMERFTGNPAGTGGLVTFKDSNWLMSVVLPRQPHFLNQPEDVQVFWGYGLRPALTGNRIDKPMSGCSGMEILEELFYHLPIGDQKAKVAATANCIPCMMPFITSQFMPRSAGDRPPVIPLGARNFAFLGQFCELPADTVFTVEYSVRTAQTAVFGLLDLKKRATPLYRGYRNPGVVLRALRALA